jgi:hypothetical protein
MIRTLAMGSDDLEDSSWGHEITPKSFKLLCTLKLAALSVPNMAFSLSAFLKFSFITIFVCLVLVNDQSTKATSTTTSELTATIAGQVVTHSPQFTVPASADEGVSLIPNIQDPEAVDAQTVCPGYIASDVVKGNNGFSATLKLAGNACKYVNGSRKSDRC